MKKAKAEGFTLIEALVTVSVLAIVMSIAIPSFQDTMRNNRLATRAQSFVSSMALARSHADKGHLVSMCAANTAGTACAGGTDWSNGWLVFSDDPSSTLGIIDNINDNVFHRVGPSGVSTTTTAASITLDRSELRNPAADFQVTVTKAGCKGDNKHVITVSKTSRKATVVKQSCP